jgi:hypothetical protein
MNTLMSRGCLVHRAALFDFVDGLPRSQATRPALAHLERCRACEDDLAGIVRTVAALRRLGRAVGATEPPGDGWVNLRSTAERPPERRWATGGSVAGPLLALSIVTAMTVHLGGLPRVDGEFSGPSTAVSRLDGFEPKVLRLSSPDRTVYASAPDTASALPLAPDGDRGNLAGIWAQSGPGHRPARSVSKA